MDGCVGYFIVDGWCRGVGDEALDTILLFVGCRLVERIENNAELASMTP